VPWYPRLLVRTSGHASANSGPARASDGRLHPRFSRKGESRKYRNGVGVRDASSVIFAISDDEVSFGAFARFSIGPNGTVC
jgi:uncharacterized protein YigE (DUF2233 family)